MRSETGWSAAEGVARRGLLLAAAAGALVMSVGCAAPTAKSDDEATKRELKAFADAWDQALVTKDRAGIEANMAPDFTQMRAGGTVVDRAQFIQDVLHPAFRMDAYRVEDFGIRLYGDTALVTGRIRMTGTDEGQPWNAHFRYIDTYVRRDGRWRVVSVQVTPMSKDE